MLFIRQPLDRAWLRRGIRNVAPPVTLDRYLALPHMLMEPNGYWDSGLLSRQSILNSEGYLRQKQYTIDKYKKQQNYIFGCDSDTADARGRIGTGLGG